IPFAHTASQVSPARGFVSSANQHSVDEGYPYWTYHGHLEYFRNRRINAVLAGLANGTPEDMMRLQHDGFDRKAEEGLAAMFPLLDSTTLDDGARGTLRDLLRWDRVSRHDGEE